MNKLKKKLPFSKEKILLLVVFTLIAQLISAQQKPHFTQYMYNMSVLNPAYATATESVLNLGTLYRSQWIEIEGAPKTVTLFAHIPVNKKIEMGFSLISDDIGDGAKKETNFYADFAYLLQLSNNQKISFGLKAGVTSLNTNFNGFVLNSGNANTDAAFADDTNRVVPNIGVGVYYFTDHYYLGASAPNLLSSEHFYTGSEISSFGKETTHAYFTGGYVFKLSETFKLKPAFMSIFVKGAPVSVDLTANILYNNKFELGAAYRVNDAISGLMNIQVLPNLKVGYAYDYSTSNLNEFNSGSHEICVLFNLDLLSKGYDKSPRFF